MVDFLETHFADEGTGKKRVCNLPSITQLLGGGV